MKLLLLFTLFAGLLVCSSQAYAVEATLPEASAAEEAESSGWRFWEATKKAFQPVRNYFTDTLPEKTPAEVASDISDAAVDAYDRINEHQAVQTAKDVLSPVGDWIRDTAQDIGNTRIQDLYDSAANHVRRADETVAGLIDQVAESINSEDTNEPKILH